MRRIFMFLTFRHWAIVAHPASGLMRIEQRFYTRSAAVRELHRLETASVNGHGAPRSTHFMLGKLY